MNINTVFESNYLKADEIQGDAVVTISRIELEKLSKKGEKEEIKPIIYFNEMKKGLCANKTNSNTIAGMYGPETDNWIGKRITLFATEVDFQGSQVLAIRVRIRPPASGGQSLAPQQQQPAAQRPAVGDIVASARRAAWDAFLAANPGKSKDEVAEPWKAHLKNIYPDKAPNMFGVNEWGRVKDAIAEMAFAGGDEYFSDEPPL